MPDKKVLVLHHTLNPPGGGSAVGAWVLQALAGRYDVTVQTWGEADVPRINQAFGTRLDREAFRWRTVPVALRRSIDCVPLPLALLSTSLLFRATRRLCQQERFDAVISSINELDVGFPALQYVHYPWGRFPRPRVDYRWYHFALPLRLYRELSMGIAEFDAGRVAANVTLVNSDWTGRVFQERYGAVPRTLYPPVPGGFPEVPFEQRARGFVCVGRIAPEKELEKLIEILARVRRRNHDVTLTFIGHVDNRRYHRRVLRASAPHADWIKFCHDLPRAAMVDLVARHRYGIHGMVGEHFGIAPAELQRAGCITFVPDDGGPVEIVGRDERVIYHGVDDAADKIHRMLSDPAHEADLQRGVEARRGLFSEERFMREIREVVDSFIEGGARGEEGRAAISA
jgi:glycosyltransferase involved in cell wall biosynthesis